MRPHSLTVFVLASSALSCLPVAGQRAALPVSPPPSIDRYVADVMRAFEVPGVGLGIVKDGQVVLARGYGVRQLGQTAPVDAETLFGIASNTKAFTATALGILVEEGNLAWDEPVIRYLPWFRLSDPYVTSELTVRDLLVHRSGLGLGAGDLLWWPPSSYDRHEIARRLRDIPLATSFRSAYAYDNVLYGVAGEVIEAVSGMSWEEFVGQRILARVGMTGSNVYGSRGGAEPNTAWPHARVSGTVQAVTPFASDNVNPAGGINSSATDMAKWMIVQMDSGRLGGAGRLFSARTARELWTGVTPLPIGNVPPDMAPLQANFNLYALGFNVRDYRGEKLVTHTGGLPGYVSRLAMIPDRKLGVVILTNQESGAAFNAIAWHVLDFYLGATDTDWLAVYQRQDERVREMTAAAERRTAAERDTASRPSLPLDRYAGTYRDAWYGDVSVVLENGELSIRFERTPLLVGPLEHWQYDTFVARWTDRTLRADAYVTFVLGPDGRVETAMMAPASPTVDFSFDFQDLALRRVR